MHPFLSDSMFKKIIIDRYEILRLLCENPNLSTGNVGEILNVNRHTARKNLVELKMSKLVVDIGTTNNPLKPVSHRKNPKAKSNENPWRLTLKGFDTLLLFDAERGEVPDYEMIDEARLRNESLIIEMLNGEMYEIDKFSSLADVRTLRNQGLILVVDDKVKLRPSFG